MVTVAVFQIDLLISELGPQWGWGMPLLWLAWQIYAPYLFDRETLISGFYEKFDNIESRQKEQKKLQTAHMMVTRANSRVLDEDLKTSIDSEKVDDYLADNGVTVEHFIDDAEGPDTAVEEEEE